MPLSSAPAKRQPTPTSSRDAILDAAAAVFSEKGFAGTSIRDIADAANIRSASLYYHFASKEEIFQEVMRIGIDAAFAAVRAAVESAPSGASHRERLSRAIRAHLVSALERGPYTQVNIRCSGQLAGRGREVNAELRRPYDAYWRKLIKAGIAAGEFDPDTDATLCSLFIFGSMNWAVHWYRPDRFSLDEIATSYERMLFDGLLPSPEPARDVARDGPRLRRA